MHNRNHNENEREIPDLALLLLGLQEAGLSFSLYLAIASGGASPVEMGDEWQPLLAGVDGDDDFENEADDEAEAEDEILDRLPFGILAARQLARQNAASLNAGIRASFVYQQPELRPVAISDDDIIRSVIPYFKAELDDDMGVFKENLNKLSLASQLKLIQYLIERYEAAESFMQDSQLEKIINELDENQIFGSLESAIKKITRKDVAVEPNHLVQVRNALSQTLREIETTLLNKPKANSKELDWDSELNKEKEEKSSPKTSVAVSPAGIFSARGSSSAASSQPNFNPPPGGLVPRNPLAVLTVGFEYLNTEGKKEAFLENLNDYLIVNGQLGRADLLDLFAELKKPKGEFEFVHQQKNHKWDRFRLLFKSNRNGPDESNFWHTATYQAAVKILKEAYLNKPANLSRAREQEENYFIDYVRGNASVHHSQTDSRKKFSR